MSRCRSASRLSTAACTETSSALVGSSATSRLGPRHQRAGDADPLPLAAGQLVRVALGDLRRAARPGSSSSATRGRASRPREPCPCSRSGSATTSPTSIRGSSEPAGSWKTIETSRRCGRSCAPGQVGHVGAGQPHRARGRLQQPHDAPADGRLARAALADQRESPGRGRIRSDTPSTARTGPKCIAQVLAARAPARPRGRPRRAAVIEPSVLVTASRAGPGRRPGASRPPRASHAAGVRTRPAGAGGAAARHAVGGRAPVGERAGVGLAPTAPAPGRGSPAAGRVPACRPGAGEADSSPAV